MRLASGAQKMTRWPTPSNDNVNAPAADLVEVVGGGCVGTPSVAENQVAVLERSLEMLEAVRALLQALSPGEIQTAAQRAHLERLGDVDAVCWKLYSDRHRILSDVFATQHAMYRERAQACMERGSLPPES